MSSGQARLRGTAPSAQALAGETRALLQASLVRLRELLPCAARRPGAPRPDPNPEPGSGSGPEPEPEAPALLEAALQGLADLAWERHEFRSALRLYVQAGHAWLKDCHGGSVTWA